MALTTLAANQSLQWLDFVGTVALFTPSRAELAGVPYARQPVTFSPVTNGVRYSQEVLTFAVPGNKTVAWYGLIDGANQLMALMPNYTGNVSNQPALCYFIDTAAGWIDAPAHGMSVGQQCIFLSGQSPYTNTALDSHHDTLGSTVTYNTLSYSISSRGAFWLWTVIEIEANRFRVVLFDGTTDIFVPSYTGWGYFQRIDQSVFDSGGGTLRIDSIRIAEFG